MRDCSVVCLIVVGLATFMNAETRSTEESATPFSLLGVVCISTALVIDAAIINIQVRLIGCVTCLFSCTSGTAVYVSSFCLMCTKRALRFRYRINVPILVALALFSEMFAGGRGEQVRESPGRVFMASTLYGAVRVRAVLMPMDRLNTPIPIPN